MPHALVEVRFSEAELRGAELEDEACFELGARTLESMLEPGRTEPTPYALRHVPLGSMRPVESAPR